MVKEGKDTAKAYEEPLTQEDIIAYQTNEEVEYFVDNNDKVWHETIITKV